MPSDKAMEAARELASMAARSANTEDNMFVVGLAEAIASAIDAAVAAEREKLDEAQAIIDYLENMWPREVDEARDAIRARAGEG